MFVNTTINSWNVVQPVLASLRWSVFIPIGGYITFQGVQEGLHAFKAITEGSLDDASKKVYRTFWLTLGGGAALCSGILGVLSVRPGLERLAKSANIGFLVASFAGFSAAVLAFRTAESHEEKSTAAVEVMARLSSMGAAVLFISCRFTEIGILLCCLSAATDVLNFLYNNTNFFTRKNELDPIKSSGGFMQTIETFSGKLSDQTKLLRRLLTLSDIAVTAVALSSLGVLKESLAKTIPLVDGFSSIGGVASVINIHKKEGYVAVALAVSVVALEAFSLTLVLVQLSLISLSQASKSICLQSVTWLFPAVLVLDIANEFSTKPKYWLVAENVTKLSALGLAVAVPQLTVPLMVLNGVSATCGVIAVLHYG